MNKAIGPDVSFYQDDNATPRGVEFSRMAENASFVIIRAGQNIWIDQDFVTNWKAAKVAGIPRGSYWFYDSRVDPRIQAELWIQALNNDFGELPLWCDFEDKYSGGFSGWKHWYNFIEEVKRLTDGRQSIGIYTGYYYWLENTIVKAIPTASLKYFKQYPLWIAAYNAQGPVVPKPWLDWTLWQYTDNGNGSLYGVESKNIDLNYFNGDEEAFRNRFGLGATTNPPISNALRVKAIFEDDQVVIYKEIT